VKTKKMTKPENKLVPKMVRKWVPKIAMPTNSIDLKYQVKKSSHGL
jgi:hypothetical protein